MGKVSLHLYQALSSAHLSRERKALLTNQIGGCMEDEGREPSVSEFVTLLAVMTLLWLVIPLLLLEWLAGLNVVEIVWYSMGLL